MLYTLNRFYSLETCLTATAQILWTKNPMRRPNLIADDNRELEFTLKSVCFYKHSSEFLNTKRLGFEQQNMYMLPWLLTQSSLIRLYLPMRHMG